MDFLPRRGHIIGAVESGDAKPTVEALEAERTRLKELERNLAVERDRIQAAAAREIALMQEVLREAAERASQRERELEAAARRLERKLAGGLVRRFSRVREQAREAKDDRELERRERALAERERRVSEAAAEMQAEATRL